jgi:hypothetical protein
MDRVFYFCLVQWLSSCFESRTHIELVVKLGDAGQR